MNLLPRISGNSWHSVISMWPFFPLDSRFACCTIVPSWARDEWSCCWRWSCGTWTTFVVTLDLSINTKTNWTIIGTFSELFTFSIPFSIMKTREWSLKFFHKLDKEFFKEFQVENLPTKDSGSGRRVRGTSSSGCLNTTVESSILLWRPKNRWKTEIQIEPIKHQR